MRIALAGCGRMGRMIESSALKAGHEITAAVGADNVRDLETLGDADVLMDFSHPLMLPHAADYVRRTGTAYLSGTTGLSMGDLDIIRGLGAFAPVVHCQNFSLGIAVMRRALLLAAPMLRENFDMELTETHHREKTDAPSGTAKLLIEAADARREYRIVYGREGTDSVRSPKEIGVHSLRGGSAAGEHSFSFLGEDEQLVFTHRADSRRVFAEGALHVAGILVGMESGFYTLDELLEAKMI